MIHSPKLPWLVLVALWPLLSSPLLAATADLAISKSDGQDVAAQGEPLVYTVVASNLGPDDALGAAVADILPNALDNVTWSCVASAGSSCPAAGQGNLSVQLDLLAGGTATFTLEGTLDADATGQLTNTATILNPGGVTDPNPGNNSATDITQLTPLVDLFVQLDDGRASAVPGEETTYQLVVGNGGPQTADGAQLDAQWPVGLLCQWQCTASGGAHCPQAFGSGDLAQTVQLPPTARLTYGVDCQIPSDRGGTLLATAAVDAGSTTTELALLDNGASDATVLTPVADVTIQVSDQVTTAVPGRDQLTYTITVGNLGPSDATSVVVRDDFPQLLGDLPWTCLAAGAATCTPAGSGDLVDTIHLPAGNSVSYFATADVPSDAQGTLVDLATVTPPGSVTDPNENNNQASDSTLLTPQVDLRLTKTDNLSVVAPGSNLTYRLRAVNLGPSDAPASTVSDVLPTPLSCTWTCLADPGATCQGSGQGDLAQVVDLAAGRAVEFTLACAVGSDAVGTLENTAQVIAASFVSETHAADNQATDITDLAARADLRVTLSDQRTAAVPGTSLTYVLEIDNAGPSNVDDARVLGSFGEDLSCTWTCQGFSGGQCTPGQVAGDIDDTARLPMGGRVVYTVPCAIDPGATGTLVATASVESSEALDPFLQDNTASDGDTVLTPTVDLSILKDDGSASASPGETLTYQLTVHNDGPSDAVGARVVDLFPDQIETVDWSCSPGLGAQCGSGSGTLDDTIDLPAGVTLTYSAVARLLADAQGTVTNTARVSPGVGSLDSDGSNDQGTDITLLAPRAEMSITVDDGLTSIAPGEPLTYTITVANGGPADVQGAVVRAQVTDSLSQVQWTCSATGGGPCGAGGSGSGDVELSVDLAAGASLMISVVGIVHADASGTLSQSVTVALPDGVADSNLGDNTASDIDTALTPRADLDLSLDNGQETTVPGLGVTYSLSLFNSGPSHLPAGQLTVPLPEGLQCSWTCLPSEGSTCPTLTLQGAIDEEVQLAAGTGLDYLGDCTVDAAAVGSLSLSGEVQGAVSDADPSNNQASDVDTLTPRVDIVTTKTDGRNLATPGESLTYTLRVKNLAGPSDAPGVTVQDVFPGALRDCLWTCQGEHGATCSQGQTAGHLLDVADLPVGSEAVYTATCSIADEAEGSVVNGVTATLPPGISDSNASNNSALDSTQLIPLVDLSVEISDDTEEAVPGESVTYRLRVRHLSGPAIEDAQVVDAFPPELDCLWTCVGIDGGICTPGQVHGDVLDTVDLPVGAELHYTASCAIAASARGSLENTATVELPASAHDPVAANNQSSDLDTVLQPTVDVAVSLTDGVTSVAPGGPLAPTIEVHNAGPSAVDGVRVEVPFSADLDCTWTCATFNGATCTAGPIVGDVSDFVDLPPTSHLRYDATCTVVAAAGSTLLQSATVELPVGVVDSQPLNNAARDDDTQVQIVTDLSLDLDNGQTVSVPGSVQTYDLEVRRSEDLFAFQTLAPKIAGDPTSLLVRQDPQGQVDPVGMIRGTSCDRLRWGTESRDGQGPGLEAHCHPTPAFADGWRPVLPPRAEGGDEPFSIAEGLSAISDLPAAVVEATVQSVVPSAMVCTWTCAASPGSACDPAPAAGTLNESVTLAAGGVLSFAAQCLIDPTASGELTLAGQLILPPGVVDPTVDDLQTVDVDLLEPRADLQLSKTDDASEATPGEIVTYTLMTHNAGPSDAPGAVLRDVFSDVLDCLWSCAPSGGATCAAGQVAGDLFDTLQLPAGSTVTHTANCRIAADAEGTLSNTAQVTAPAAVVEVDPSNNEAADLDTVLVPTGDLRVVLDDGVQQAVPGTELIYLLDVGNAGPSHLNGVRVLDTLPQELSCLWSCEPEDGASCSAGQSSTPLNDLVNLPSGSAVHYTIVCQIAPEARGTLVYQARVELPPGASDPDTSNNLGRDDDTELQPRADLSITKDDGVVQVAPGDSVHYTLEVTNAGPSSDQGVQVEDLFPEILDCLWTCQPSPGTVCTQGPTQGPLLDVIQLPAQGQAIYSATCQLSGDATGQLLNHGTVTPGLGVEDPNLLDNSASDLDEITPLADLTLSKSDGVSEAVPGQNLTYTLVAGNPVGPSHALGARLSDQVSPLLDCSWTCSATGNGQCGSNTGGGDLEVDIDLPVGAVVTWQGHCDILPEATGTLSNTAVLHPPQGVLDLDPGNNTASDTDTLLVPTADLAISKDDGVAQVLAGENVTYTMVATNLGPSHAPQVRVHDPFPGELQCSWSCSATAGANCSPGPVAGDLLDQLDMAAGSQATYTAVCTVAEDAVGEISNTVTIDAEDVVDPDEGNNSATDVDALSDTADLAIRIVDAPDPVAPGGLLLHVLTVENLGPAAEAGAVLSLTLPGLTQLQGLVLGGPEVVFGDGFESGTTAAWGGQGGLSSSCQAVGDTLSCELGVLVSGGMQEATLSLRVDDSAEGVLLLTATVDGQGADPDSANDTASELTTVD